MGIVTIGIDIGQKRDPTAIAVVEQENRNRVSESNQYATVTRGPAAEHHMVRHLERLPLGTPYPDITKRLGEIIERVRLQTAQRAADQEGWIPDHHPSRISPYVNLTVYVDATGVGQPVVDLLTAAKTVVNPVYFTHGDRRTEEKQVYPLKGVSVSLGKAWLVSRLQALLQTGRIHLPDTNEARVLAKELQDYEIKVTEDANDKYGAFKVGTHDDLVTALGLAVQGCQKPRGVYQSNSRYDSPPGRIPR
ncbi:MAG: hypothetical protein V4671_22640 [Armatimonadota bacterium]